MRKLWRLKCDHYFFLEGIDEVSVFLEATVFLSNVSHMSIHVCKTIKLKNNALPGRRCFSSISIQNFHLYMHNITHLMLHDRYID